MPHEIDFDRFAGMTRNEIESDPNWPFMYELYCRAWERGDLVEVDRILPKLGMRRIGSSVDWVNW